MVDSKKTILYGIISGGDGNCSTHTPDVHTKVSHYLDYIFEEVYYTFVENRYSVHPSVLIPKAANVPFYFQNYRYGKQSTNWRYANWENTPYRVTG